MPTPPSPTMSAQEGALLVLLSILWGGTFLFAKVAVAEIPPLTLVFMRVAIAATTLLVVLGVMRVPFSGIASTWTAFFGMGLLNNVIPFSLLFIGQQDLGAGLESILNATTPIFTVLVLHIATRDERLTLLKGLGVLLGFAGVVLLVGPEALSGLAGHARAELLCLGATFSYALALLYGRRFKGTPPLVTATGQLIASSLMMAPLSIAIDRPWTLAIPSVPALASVTTMALLSTALSYIIYFRIMARAGATNAALVTFLIPVSAIALGALVLGEKLTLLQVIGFGTILAGLAAIDGRAIRYLFRSRPAEQA